MKNILVYGLSPTIGGVERIVTDVIKRTSNQVAYTILLSGLGLGQFYTDLGKNVTILSITAWGENRRKFRKEIIELLLNNSFDYIWINGCIMANRDVIEAAKRFKGLKIILHSHGSSFEEPNPLKKIILYALHRLNRRLYLRELDIAFMCSFSSGKWFYGSKYCKTGNVKLFKNGIDTAKYRFNPEIRTSYRQKLGLDQEIAILNVGRLSPVKNQKKLLDITSECVSAGMSVRLIIVGDGELKKTLASYAERLKIRENVSFLGARDDVEAIYQAADIFILPSLHEGFPISLLEAQSSGLSCIASTGISPEANIDGNVIFLSNDSDNEIWVDAIKDAASKSVCRESAFRTIIDRGFDIDSICKEFLSEIIS